MRTALQKAGVKLTKGGAVRLQPGTGPGEVSGASPIRWIDAADIENWANRLDGRADLPELISRLVRASAPQVTRVHFPSRESSDYGGWDGITENPQASEYVPADSTGWEIGAQANRIPGKATQDYQARKKDPLGLRPSNTAFIFVTPRRWKRGKSEWLANAKAEGHWAGVRVYDVDDLVHWIELCPPVGAWLAAKIGKRPSDVRLLEEAWSEWSVSTIPSITAELVLAGRDNESAKVLHWLLYEQPSCLSLKAQSKEESAAFLYATISQLPQLERDTLLSRAMVADSARAARHLSDSHIPLIIVLDAFDAGLAQQIARRGHHVFIRSPDTIVAGATRVDLPRAPREQFAAALVNMGLKKEEAESLAQETARSLSVWRRLRASTASGHAPPWSLPENAPNVLPALLAGAWNEGNKGDRKLLEELSGKTYEELSPHLVRWLSDDDGLLRKAGTEWKLVSSRDAWLRLARYLTKIEVDRFAGVVLKALGANDPRFDMDPEKRWSAAIYGVEPICSDSLRTGLCETLILLSVFGEEAENITTPTNIVDGIVYKLLHRADTVRWWSVSGYLKLLAEAAPKTFLTEVDASLSAEPSPIMGIFQEDGGLVGGIHHSQLLWAMEMLAWDPFYLAIAAKTLAILAEKDPVPGSKWVNRPFRSLREIFLLWSPQTAATLEQRLVVIDLLRATSKKVSWPLLLSLLPKHHDIQNPTSPPRWRPIPPVTEEVTWPLLTLGANEVLKRVLEDVGSDGPRWVALIEHFDTLTAPQFEGVVTQLVSAADQIADVVVRTHIWHALREFISHHRAGAGTNWAWPEQPLTTLHQVSRKFRPKGFLELTSWMFESEKPSRFRPCQFMDWQAEEKLVERIHLRIIKRALSRQDGEAIVIALAQAAKQPWLVARALVQASPSSSLPDKFIFEFAGNSERWAERFVFGLEGFSYEKWGLDWLRKTVAKSQVESWSQDQLISLLLVGKASQETWTYIESLGTDTRMAYWRRAPIYGNKTPEEEAYILARLLEVNRARTAVQLLAYQKGPVASKVAIEVLRKAAQEPVDASSNHDLQMFQHYLEQLLLKLDKAKDVATDDIASLEWTYLPLLEHSHRPPMNLHRMMSQVPEFFVEVISALYRSDKDDESMPMEGTEEWKVARARAHHAYTLLQGWRTAPGEIDGKIDAQTLISWIQKARQLSKEAGRLEPADKYIGRVLAFSPIGEDNVWPAQAVRDAIELNHGEGVIQGLLSGIRSKRGVTTRGILEGGRQERALANGYREWSKATALRWPHTSAVLDTMAEGLETEAEWNDDQAAHRDWT